MAEALAGVLDSEFAIRLRSWNTLNVPNDFLDSMPDDDPRYELIVIPHAFETELDILVVTNHRLTLEGIERAELEAIAEISETLENDPEEAESTAGWISGYFYNGLRTAANRLALVGLVTLFQSWIERLARSRKIAVKASSRDEPRLLACIQGLNDHIQKAPPAPAEYFRDLADARDSVIHGDSKAQWGKRTVAARYQGDSELNFTADDLREAVTKAIAQVKWYEAELL